MKVRAVPQTAPARPLIQARVAGVDEVALSFDDGPSLHTLEVLAVLRRYEVRATFFVLGREVHGREDILRQVVAEGHELGNHTMTHALLIRDHSRVRAEVAEANELIRSVAGVAPRLFRPPFGEFDAYSTGVLKELGLKPVLWDVDPKDWAPVTPEELTERVVADVGPGSIVLLHDGPAGERDATVEALPGVIEALRERGHNGVTISDLLAEGRRRRSRAPG